MPFLKFYLNKPSSRKAKVTSDSCKHSLICQPNSLNVHSESHKMMNSLLQNILLQLLTLTILTFSGHLLTYGLIRKFKSMIWEVNIFIMKPANSLLLHWLKHQGHRSIALSVLRIQPSFLLNSKLLSWLLDLFLVLLTSKTLTLYQHVSNTLKTSFTILKVQQRWWPLIL